MEEGSKRAILSKLRFQIECFKRLAELNCLKVEQRKIKDLVQADRKDLVLVKSELNKCQLDAALELHREEAKQLELGYELDIKLPAQLERHLIEKTCQAKGKRARIELEADAFKIKTLGAAQVCQQTLVSLTEAKGLRQVAAAWQQYYTALLLDRVAEGVLRFISHRYNIDPQFRIRLEWPMRSRRRMVSSPIISDEAAIVTSDEWEKRDKDRQKRKFMKAISIYERP